MSSTEEKPAKRPIYEESSQYRHWRFSAAQLREIREASNRAAVERVKQNVHEEMQVANNNNGSEDKSEDMRYLTVQDELALCQFYEKQLQGICRHLKFTDAVMATAVMYMKRFFLYNTVMDYHPKDILLTCLFLSTKSESERISIDQFGKSLKLPSTDTVLKLEFTVSQGLKFEFLVHHPYRPAYGFFLDMQTLGIDHKALLETYNKVKQQVIPNILLTDLPLIYQPSQLALAAFMIAGKEKLEKQILQYMETRLGSEDAKATRQVMEEIAKVVGELKLVTPNEAKVIDRRLRVCVNPAKNPDSALYKKRAAEKDEDRRKKKARVESDDDDDDEFDDDDSS